MYSSKVTSHLLDGILLKSQLLSLQVLAKNLRVKTEVEAESLDVVLGLSFK